MKKKILLIWHTGAGLGHLHRLNSIASILNEKYDVKILTNSSYTKFIKKENLHPSSFQYNIVGSYRTPNEYIFKSLTQNFDIYLEHIFLNEKYDYIIEDSCVLAKFIAQKHGIPHCSLNSGFLIPNEYTEKDMLFSNILVDKNNNPLQPITHQENIKFGLLSLEKLHGVGLKYESLSDWYDDTNILIDGVKQSDIWHQLRNPNANKPIQYAGPLDRLSKNDNFIEELDDSNIFVYSSSYLEENNEQFIDTLLNQTNKHIVWVNTKINDRIISKYKNRNITITSKNYNLWSEDFNPHALITVCGATIPFVSLWRDIPLGLVQIDIQSEQVIRAKYFNESFNTPFFNNSLDRNNFINEVLVKKEYTIEKPMPLEEMTDKILSLSLFGF